MGNYKKFFVSVSFLASCVTVFGGCATPAPKSAPSEALTAIPLNEPIDLKLAPKAGREEEVRYASHSFIEHFEDAQPIRSREESVDFILAAKTLSVDPITGNSKWVVTAKNKKGPVDLHDLAFPEEGEKLEMEFTPYSEVLAAGSYPKNSVFYVPPLALPKNTKVKIGDTWKMHAQWVGLKNGLPLQMELVTVFKNLYDCKGSGRCAELEISGDVNIVGLDPTLVAFQSELRGTLLFSVDHGTVVWSQIRSEETLADRANSIRVRTCLASALKSPSREAVFGGAISCNSKP